MSNKVSQDLQPYLQGIDPQKEVPVIVTLTQGNETAELERHGFKVQNVFDSISAVSGTIAAVKINELAKLNQVKLIEYDGTVHAL